MKCKNCGKEVPEVAKVCGYCGGPLKTAEKNSLPEIRMTPKTTAQKRLLPAWVWTVIAGLSILIIGSIIFILNWKPTEPVVQNTVLPAMTQENIATDPVTSCEDRLKFIADVTIPDGSVIEPKTTFTKTWRIKNTGSCTWTTAYAITFKEGLQMDAPSAIPLVEEVPPEKEIDISVSFTAPTEPNSYKSFWQLINPDGIIIQVEGVENNAIFLDITVADPNILLYDDFNDESSGWPVFGGPDENSQVGYYDGNFRFLFQKYPCGFDAAWSREEYTDSIVETVFSTPANIPNIGAGFTLRTTDRSWYLLWIYPAQGSYIFQKDIGGKVTELIPLTQSNAIQPLAKGNRLHMALRVESRGEKFDIWIGKPDSHLILLDTINDPELTSGHLGPSADCPNSSFTPPIEVLFEWIAIYK